MNQAVYVNLSVKTVITFIMECPLYDDITRNLFVIVRIYGEMDLNIILYGNTELSIDQNKDIFRVVQVFLKDVIHSNCRFLEIINETHKECILLHNTFPSAKVFSFYIFTLLMFRKPNKTTINKDKTKIFFVGIHPFDSRLYLDISSVQMLT